MKKLKTLKDLPKSIIDLVTKKVKEDIETSLKTNPAVNSWVSTLDLDKAVGPNSIPFDLIESIVNAAKALRSTALVFKDFERETEFKFRPSQFGSSGIGAILEVKGTNESATKALRACFQGGETVKAGTDETVILDARAIFDQEIFELAAIKMKSKLIARVQEDKKIKEEIEKAVEKLGKKEHG